MNISLPTARFKVSPEDFVVDEIDAYPATGEGPHTLVRFRKRGLTTEAAVARLAAALGVDKRACGHAGLKDKEAVTTQRISLPDVAPEAVLALRWDDLEVLEAVRHRNKLKPGHLHGNRFDIVLRDVSDVATTLATLAVLAREGFPNAFGPQRFGRDGDNADRALAFVRGEERGPRDSRERRLLFSALQSRWFNRLLSTRVADGSYRVPEEGDLLKKHDTGGMFLCEDAETDRARAARGELSPTGPMFGSDMTLPGGAVLARELAVLAEDGMDLERLRPHRALGEGTRRVLRILPAELVADEQGPAVVRVRMTLPKGAYATTALAAAVSLLPGRSARDLPQPNAGSGIDSPEPTSEQFPE